MPITPLRTNPQRANAAKATMEFYFKHYINEKCAHDKPDLALLLADIRHYCDRRNINFTEALELADEHYKEEVAHA